MTDLYVTHACPICGKVHLPKSEAEMTQAPPFGPFKSERERYKATKATHALCLRCQLVQTADPDQICATCRNEGFEH